MISTAYPSLTRLTTKRKKQSGMAPNCFFLLDLFGGAEGDRTPDLTTDSYMTGGISLK